MTPHALGVQAPYQCAAEAAIACAMLTMQPPWLPSQNKASLGMLQDAGCSGRHDLVSEKSALNAFSHTDLLR